MTCDVALEQMLEADPEHLLPGGTSALADHLAGCPRCRAVADELTAGTALLAARLDRVPVESTVDASLLAVRSRRRLARRRPMRAVLWPLAAAAVLTVLVVADRARGPRVDPSQMLAATRPATEQTVRFSPSTNGMLLKTNNPKITIVWFY